MDFATFSSILTVLAVVSFAGIIAWTMSRRQSARFEEAAQLPFALPDENAVSPSNVIKTGEGR